MAWRKREGFQLIGETRSMWESRRREGAEHSSSIWEWISLCLFLLHCSCKETEWACIRESGNCKKRLKSASTGQVTYSIATPSFSFPPTSHFMLQRRSREGPFSRQSLLYACKTDPPGSHQLRLRKVMLFLKGLSGSTWLDFHRSFS